MANYQEILDLDFIREFADDKEGAVSLEQEYPTDELLWVGEPEQQFKFFNSGSLQEILLNSLGFAIGMAKSNDAITVEPAYASLMSVSDWEEDQPEKHSHPSSNAWSKLPETTLEETG